MPVSCEISSHLPVSLLTRQGLRTRRAHPHVYTHTHAHANPGKEQHALPSANTHAHIQPEQASPPRPASGRRALRQSGAVDARLTAWIRLLESLAVVKKEILLENKHRSLLRTSGKCASASEQLRCGCLVGAGQGPWWGRAGPMGVEWGGWVGALPCVLRPRSCPPCWRQGAGRLRNGTASHSPLLAQESSLVFPWATLTLKISALLDQVLHAIIAFSVLSQISTAGFWVEFGFSSAWPCFISDSS